MTRFGLNPTTVTDWFPVAVAMDHVITFAERSLPPMAMKWMT